MNEIVGMVVPGQVAVADGVGEHCRHLADVDAACDHLGETERSAQRAEGDDQRGHLRLGDQARR